MGPITGGLIAAEYGTRAVFITAAILVIVDVIYIVTTLPESVQRVSHRETQVNEFETAMGINWV